MRSANTAKLANLLGSSNATPHNTSLRIIRPADKHTMAGRVVVAAVGLGDDADALGLDAEGDDLALELVADLLEGTSWQGCRVIAVGEVFLMSFDLAPAREVRQPLGRTAALAASAAPWERQHLGTPRRAHLLSGDDPHELINRVEDLTRLLAKPLLENCGDVLHPVGCRLAVASLAAKQVPEQLPT